MSKHAKASHCDECEHSTIKWYIYRGGDPFPDLRCAKKHQPRFYCQRNDNPFDPNYGWKRVCADFSGKDIQSHADTLLSAPAAS